VRTSKQTPAKGKRGEKGEKKARSKRKGDSIPNKSLSFSKSSREKKKGRLPTAGRGAKANFDLYVRGKKKGGRSKEKKRGKKRTLLKSLERWES